MEYSDNNIKHNLKYLDKILDTNLKKSDNYKIDAKKLADNINPIDLESLFNQNWTDKLVGLFAKKKSLADMAAEDFEIEIPKEFNSEESKFVNALWYLHSQGLIVFNPSPVNESLLTFKGIMKISNGGFYKEYKRQKRRDFYQRYFWIVAILTFMIGWVLKPLVELLTKVFSI